MKRKLLFIFIFIFLFFVTKIVYAKDCRYGIPSPPIYYDGRWTKEQTHTFTTSAYSCLAKNINVTFSTGSWHSKFPIEIEAILMEDDEDPNPDDPVKTYYGRNYSYKEMEWSVKEVHDEGNLDSAGDKTCELYMKFKLVEPVVESNHTSYFETDLFRYTICVD